MNYEQIKQAAFNDELEKIALNPVTIRSYRDKIINSAAKWKKLSDETGVPAMRTLELQAHNRVFNMLPKINRRMGLSKPGITDASDTVNKISDKLKLSKSEVEILNRHSTKGGGYPYDFGDDNNFSKPINELRRINPEGHHMDTSNMTRLRSMIGRITPASRSSKILNRGSVKNEFNAVKSDAKILNSESVKNEFNPVKSDAKIIKDNSKSADKSKLLRNLGVAGGAAALVSAPIIYHMNKPKA